MKIDRRSFLSFVIGGAAGTALSPLPWKLTDDISIWSQMWPWVPVPERGEVSYVNSACTLCPGGCGISIRKVENRVVKIEGREDHPVNEGGLCALGLSGAQLLYGPRRVKAPMKKVNGRFREISWKRALSDVSEALTDLRSKGQAHTVACISGSGRGTVAELLNRFLQVYGSQNFIRTPSIADSYESMLHLMQGVRATAGFDVNNADYVLSFGSGVLEGWGSPVYLFNAHSRMQANNAKLVQVEPRLSNTGAKADSWIAINPGTEGALALGMAHVMIKESLYNEAFINNYCTGFDEWKRHVLDGYSPAIVSKVTGVSSAAITSLARSFTRAAKPVALCGRGKGLTPGSLKEFMAVHTLNALVGNIGNAGGVWAVPEPEYVEWPEPEMDQTASKGLQVPRIDGAGSDPFQQSRYLLNRLTKAMKASSKQLPINLLFVAEANPAYSQPDSAAFREALDKIPLVVSFSSYMDETAEMADLILPNHTYLERYQDVPVAAGYPLPLINLAQPAVEPLFNTMHTGDVVIQLAGSLGGSIAAAFPWEDYQTCLEQTMGDKWDAMVEEGYWTQADFSAPSPAQAFETESGKFEFINADIDALSRYSPVKPEGDEATYPLLLIPYDTMRLWADYIASPQFLMKSLEETILLEDDVLLELNPTTAESLGLKDGKIALLSTPVGKARVKIRLFEGIMPGLLALPRGLGHTAFEKNLAGKGANVNELIGPVEDSATGHDAAWGIRAKLSKA